MKLLIENENTIKILLKIKLFSQLLKLYEGKNPQRWLPVVGLEIHSLCLPSLCSDEQVSFNGIKTWSFDHDQLLLLYIIRLLGEVEGWQWITTCSHIQFKIHGISLSIKCCLQVRYDNIILLFTPWCICLLGSFNPCTKQADRND